MDQKKRNKTTSLNKNQFPIRGVLETLPVEQLYNVGSDLGSGVSGVVRIVEKKNFNKIRFAMKCLPIEEDFKELVQREYDILKKLDHPFTMNMVEVYCDKKKNELQLILPFYEGGDVYSLIQSKGNQCIPEADVARFIWQVLRALCYLNKKGIAHRDLKPENLVFESKAYGKESYLKVIDFGFAIDMKDLEHGDDTDSLIFMGTPYYMAPEVINKEKLVT